jgi:hypothetical protein
MFNPPWQRFNFVPRTRIGVKRIGCNLVLEEVSARNVIVAGGFNRPRRLNFNEADESAYYHSLLRTKWSPQFKAM